MGDYLIDISEVNIVSGQILKWIQINHDTPAP